MMNYPLEQINTSFRPNFLVSVVIAIWVSLFILLVKPFQVEPLDNSRWFILALGYGLIAFLSYQLITILQNAFFANSKKWSLKHEAIFFATFYAVSFFPCFLFNKSELNRGLYTLPEFTLYIFLPCMVILTPLILFARIHLIKQRESADGTILIQGRYKLDFLKVETAHLICVSSAKNYVEIHFLKDGVLAKKILRMSLRKAEKDIPFLTRVHRSHLINPSHILSWKDKNTIALTQMEIPVSKNFKSNILVS